MASMINRAGNVVEPTAASVAYAIMDQGGNLDSNFNAVVSSTSLHLTVVTRSELFILGLFCSSTLVSPCSLIQ